MTKHSITLLTGVPAVIRPFGGREQKILTEDSSLPFSSRLYLLLASFVISVGDVTIADLEFDARHAGNLSTDKRVAFFMKMLACDRKFLLCEGRRITHEREGEDDADFTFTHKYKDIDGNEAEITKDLDLTDGFPIRYPKVFDENLIKGLSFKQLKKSLKDITDKAANINVTDYEQVEQYKTFIIQLPYADEVISGNRMVRLTMLDGKGEAVADTTDNKSSHTALRMRNACFMRDDTVPIQLQDRDMDKMHILNLDYIRLVLRIFEGQVDTELMFDNPEAQFKMSAPKEVVTDLLSQMAFFFAAEGI